MSTRMLADRNTTPVVAPPVAYPRFPANSSSPIVTWALAVFATLLVNAVGIGVILSKTLGTSHPSGIQAKPRGASLAHAHIEHAAGQTAEATRADENQGPPSHPPPEFRRAVEVAMVTLPNFSEAKQLGSDTAILPEDTAIEMKAFAGEPFGAGKITVDFPEGRRPRWHADQFIHLEGRRAHYPAFHIHYALGSDRPRSQVDRYECFFLFQGREPLEIKLLADTTHAARTAPLDDPKSHTDLLQAWWRNYRKPQRLFSAKYDQPGIVHDYLTSMLARRLELSNTPRVRSSSGSSFLVQLFFEFVLRSLADSRPPRDARSADSNSSIATGSSFVRSRLQGSLVFDFDRFLGLLFGTESIRIAFQTDKTLADTDRSEIADRPLPRPMAVPPVRTTGSSYGTSIEPIALHVPQDCFYLRCRSLAEYLWLRNLVVRWGGSFNDLISTEAVDHQIRPKIERQLAFYPESEMREELDDLISDMALIGTDILFQDGAGLGVVLESKDGAALEGLVRRQRERTERQFPEATERQIRFHAGAASFLSTPDNRVRSFHAIHGNYQLITNSSYIVERFFEAGKGKTALGNLAEFRYARSVMPLEREDAVFIYLSDPFFRLIIGPRYRIEMTRRAWAIRDWKHAYLARLSARAEGAPTDTVESLIRRGFLPGGFLIRPDGSRPVLRDGIIYDSLRGAIGTFRPIPDMEVAKATKSEVESYHRFANDYRRQWRRMDPVSVGVYRKPGSGQRERVVLDVRITPYARENYERLHAQLDPPDQYQLAQVRGDVMTVEARLRSFGTYLPTLRAQHPRAFAGLRDFAAPFTVRDGGVQTLSLDPFSLVSEDYQSYAGTVMDEDPWLEVTGDGHSNQGDPTGYSLTERAFFAILTCRRTWNNHWVAWAHDRSILEQVTPQLRLEQANRPAQVRFRLGDLAASDLGSAVQAICYMHARRISALNARQIHQMIEQFKSKPNEAQRAAEELLGGRMICPLGGEYELTAGNGATPCCKSTAWQHDSAYLEDQIPGDYCHPFLDWLRGARMELTLDRTTLSTHVELDVKPSAESAAGPAARVAALAPPLMEDAPRSSLRPPPNALSSSRRHSDEQRIEGNWKVVDDQEYGEPFPHTKNVYLRFDDGEIVQIHKGVPTHRYRYRLRPELQPKGFDFLPKGRQIWDECGIYKLEGNRLVLCYGHRGHDRPARFDTGARGARRLVVLERVDTDGTEAP